MGELWVNRLFSSIWRKKFWQINRSANKLLIVSTVEPRLSESLLSEPSVIRTLFQILKSQ